MTKDEAKQSLRYFLYGELEPYRPTHAKDWAADIVDRMFNIFPFLAIVDRKAEPSKYKCVTEDKYDDDGKWIKSIKIEVPKTIEDILAEGYVKEVK